MWYVRCCVYIEQGCPPCPNLCTLFPWPPAFPHPEGHLVGDTGDTRAERRLCCVGCSCRGRNNLYYLYIICALLRAPWSGHAVSYCT